MSFSGFILGWAFKILIVLGIIAWLNNKIYKETKIDAIREISELIGGVLNWISSYRKSARSAATRPIISASRDAMPAERNSSDMK